MVTSSDTASLTYRVLRLTVWQLLIGLGLMLVAAALGVVAMVYSSTGFFVAAVTVGCIAVAEFFVMLFLAGMYVGVRECYTVIMQRRSS